MSHSGAWLFAALLTSRSTNAVAADYAFVDIQVDPISDNSHALFMPDDPRLPGRVFDIRPQWISSDLDDSICTRPAAGTHMIAVLPGSIIAVRT